MTQFRSAVERIRSRIKTFSADRLRVRLFQSILLVVILLGVFITYRYRLHILSSFSYRPFVSANKDWMDVFAALGEGFGIVALIALIFEIHRRRDEVLTRFKPKLKISLDLSDGSQNKVVRCLFDESNEDLEKGESSYRELRLASEAVKAEGLLVRIINLRSEAEGVARDVRVRLKLRYSQVGSWTSAQGWEKSAWFPPLTRNGLQIEPGDTKEILLRLGRPGHPYFSAEIIDFKCKNQKGDSFGGTDMLVLTRAFEELVPYGLTKESPHGN